MGGRGLRSGFGFEYCLAWLLKEIEEEKLEIRLVEERGERFLLVSSAARSPAQKTAIGRGPLP